MSAQVGDLGPEISRGEIVERAESWLRPSVPYGLHRFHQNEYGIYRTDCSGYVSMAWGLPGVPPSRHGGLDNAGLARVSVAVAKGELRAGDALLATAGTGSVIFHEWADIEREHYWGFEQSPEGTVHRRLAFPGDGAGLRPSRYLRVVTPGGERVGGDLGEGAPLTRSQEDR
ncbi:hypothetical protein [Actinokineospora sp. UTMC 2448]|uniref:hypothetical protein n=1 Tax=Actinokineospora sp. UTMC 2448 TaxID=2268449 RepID=UPI0021642238|nr:hypothetical protein [Actinokineospora sp. UTMC 2448]UVS76474.1 hypothetical protein Actkin_00161 [Actinokineospora sp. UTMC 2448]